MSEEKVTKQDCVGCRNNFYNGNNDMGIKECWSLPSAKFVTKFQLDYNTPVNQKDAYVKRTVPHCYQKIGYIFVDKIPSYAK